MSTIKDPSVSDLYREEFEITEDELKTMIRTACYNRRSHLPTIQMAHPRITYMASFSDCREIAMTKKTTTTEPAATEKKGSPLKRLIESHLILLAAKDNLKTVKEAQDMLTLATRLVAKKGREWARAAAAVPVGTRFVSGRSDRT